MRWAAIAIACELALGGVSLGCGLETSGGNAASPDAASLDATVEDASAQDASVDANDGAFDDAGDSTLPNDAGEDASEGASDVAVVDAPSDANGASDASPDAAVIPCPLGVVCNGVCTAATTCSACAGAPLFCTLNRTCLPSCATCTDSTAARPIECFQCDAFRANPVGTCEPNDPNAYCLNDVYGLATHCACTPEGKCFSPTQVCTDVGFGTPACRTCGEKMSDGIACTGGKTCQAASSSCQ